MSDTLILELDITIPEVRRAGIVSSSGLWLKDIHEAKIRDAAESAHKVIAVCNGAAFSSWQQKVPDLPLAKLHKILPNLMDDQLALPAADTHFSIVGEKSGDEISVITVERQLMVGAIEFCKLLGAEIDSLMPDFSLLAAQENPRALDCPDGFWRVSMPDGRGFTAEKPLVSSVLNSMPFSVEKVTETEWCGHMANAGSCTINLLQGEFANTQNLALLMPLARRAAALAAVALIAWMGATFYTAQSQKTQAAILLQASEEAYKKAFPEVTRIVNLEAQLRNTLRELGQGRGGQFKRVSVAVFDAVQNVDGAILESLRFDGGRGEFIITVSLNSFAAGEKFKTLLINAGVAVREGSSRQENGRVFTDLALGGMS